MTGRPTEPREGETGSESLRARAERQLAQLADETGAVSAEALRDVLHELRVHQIELEMQNEELRRAQLDLDASRARYFELYDLAPVGYLTLQDPGTILQANLRASILFGVPRGQLVGQSLGQLIAAESQDDYHRLRRRLQDGKPQTCELRLRRDDQTIWVRLDARQRSDVGLAGVGRGDEGGWWATLSDSSERRTLEASLAASDRLATMGLLAAGVTHEINNPLTYVLFAVEQIVRRTAALPRNVEGIDELTTFAQEALDGLQRIKTITAGLGAVARVEGNETSVADLRLAAQQALGMAVHELRPRAQVIEELGDVAPMRGAQGKLVQVLLNLLLNAAQAMGRGSSGQNSVTLRTFNAGNEVCGEVIDTGTGIPPEDLERIFEPFFTTKGPERGTGLGLAVCRRLVKELGGQMHVESQVGVGSRFQLRFPAAPGASASVPAPVFPTRVAKPVEAKPVEAKPVEAKPVEGARGRILVIDDEERIRQTLVRMLSRDHEVVAVASGQAAQALLSEDAHFDAIVCDVMMPGVSGLDVHAWLVEREPQLARRLIFITGGAFTPKSTAYLAHVDNPRLDKPFDVALLRKTVGELVAAARRARGD